MRLPLIHWAVEQVDKEHTWLPKIAPLLPLAVPEPLVMGQPGHGYPWHWSVYRWIDGENAHPDRIAEAGQAAIDLAEFVAAVHALDFPDAPVSKRGVPLVTQDEVTRWAINAVRHEFDARALTAVWEEAISAPPWDGQPMWVHADLTDGNILVRDGRLHAVIDFSLLGLGEPANDLDPAWGVFSGESRKAFRTALGVDDATWARGPRVGGHLSARHLVLQAHQSWDRGPLPTQGHGRPRGALNDATRRCEGPLPCPLSITHRSAVGGTRGSPRAQAIAMIWTTPELPIGVRSGRS